MSFMLSMQRHIARMHPQLDHRSDGAVAGRRAWGTRLIRSMCQCLRRCFYRVSSLSEPIISSTVNERLERVVG